MFDCEIHRFGTPVPDSGLTSLWIRLYFDEAASRLSVPLKHSTVVRQLPKFQTLLGERLDADDYHALQLMHRHERTLRAVVESLRPDKSLRNLHICASLLRLTILCDGIISRRKERNLFPSELQLTVFCKSSPRDDNLRKTHGRTSWRSLLRRRRLGRARGPCASPPTTSRRHEPALNVEKRRGWSCQCRKHIEGIWFLSWLWLLNRVLHTPCDICFHEIALVLDCLERSPTLEREGREDRS